MKQGTQPYSAKPTGANSAGSWLRPAIATGFLVVFLPVFISAGFWQLDRAAQKTAIEQNFLKQAELPPLTRPVDNAAAAEYRFRKLQLEGRFEPARQILLENIVRAGVNGYQVLTPFRTNNIVIMVNRGWLGANPDRRVLPTIEVTNDLRTLTGVIDMFPAPGMRLAMDYPADAPWPRRMLYPTQEAVAAAIDAPVASYQLLLADGEPDGYARTWQAVDMGVSTHYGYAFQWFSFGVVALVFYAILMTRWFKDRRTNIGS